MVAEAYVGMRDPKPGSQGAIQESLLQQLTLTEAQCPLQGQLPQ
jgi:hypothetical protein